MPTAIEQLGAGINLARNQPKNKGAIYCSLNAAITKGEPLLVQPDVSSALIRPDIATLQAEVTLEHSTPIFDATSQILASRAPSPREARVGLIEPQALTTRAQTEARNGLNLLRRRISTAGLN